MNMVLENHKEKIEKAIDALFCDDKPTVLTEAMKYSLAGGGKRLRPVLMMEFCRISGGNPDDIIPFAVALECIHTYSLIHDDLPCMDNDDVRRGKPSSHIKFGEANALLAGDGLLTFAFELASSAVNVKPDNAVRAINILAACAGYSGMIGGQIADLALEGKRATANELKAMYALKTGKLILAACAMGCVLAGADSEKICAAENYAQNIGLSFQIVDDLLDVIGDENLLGKPIGSDVKNEKSTFVSLYGVDECNSIVDKLTADAIKSLDVFCDPQPLSELAFELSKRTY